MAGRFLRRADAPLCIFTVCASGLKRIGFLHFSCHKGIIEGGDNWDVLAETARLTENPWAKIRHMALPAFPATDEVRDRERTYIERRQN